MWFGVKTKSRSVRSAQTAMDCPGTKPFLFVELARMKPDRQPDLLLIVFCLMLGVASPTFGQAPQPSGPPGPGGPGGPGGLGGFFGGAGIVGLIARDEVQQELQLVDEQKDKVRAITDEMRNKVREQMRDVFGQMQNLSDDERRAKFGEIRTKI